LTYFDISWGTLLFGGVVGGGWSKGRQGRNGAVHPPGLAVSGWPLVQINH